MNGIQESMAKKMNNTRPKQEDMMICDLRFSRPADRHVSAVCGRTGGNRSQVTMHSAYFAAIRKWIKKLIGPDKKLS
jgi:hypothetical protein